MGENLDNLPFTLEEYAICRREQMMIMLNCLDELYKEGILKKERYDSVNMKCAELSVKYLKVDQYR